MEKNNSSYPKKEIKGICSKHIVQLLFTIAFLSNLRRKWLGRLAMFPSDPGAWKGDALLENEEQELRR